MKLITLAALLFSMNVFSNPAGIPIDSVDPDSAYAQWSLKKGDVIKKINNKEVTSINEFREQVKNPSTVKTLTILRNNKEMEIKPIK